MAEYVMESYAKAEQINVTTGTITGSNGFAWNNSVRKSGKIVSFCASPVLSQTEISEKTWTLIGTLPQGFRPAQESFFASMDYQHDVAGGVIRIDTNGEIKAYLLHASRQILVSFIFIQS